MKKFCRQFLHVQLQFSASETPGSYQRAIRFWKSIVQSHCNARGSFGTSDVLRSSTVSLLNRLNSFTSLTHTCNFFKLEIQHLSIDMTSNGESNDNGVEAPLNRADEVKDVCIPSITRDFLTHPFTTPTLCLFPIFRLFFYNK
jgi:hypothetical protein